MQVDHVVSLGHQCRPAWHVRRVWGLKKAYPFNWWITDCEGLARFIDDGSVARLYDEAVEMVVDGKLLTIWHPGYGIQLFHDFPRSEDFTEVLPGWRDELHLALNRTQVLMDRFFALDGASVLFLREASADDTADSLVALRSSVLRRLPNATTKFLLLSAEPRAAEGWRDIEFADPGGLGAWPGDDRAWEQLLAGLGKRMNESPAAGPTRR